MLPFNPILEEQAKYLKQTLSKVDKTLEAILKQHLPDLAFEIKVPIDDYIVDFFSISNDLVIELDAGQQENTDAYVYHAERKERFENLGLKVFRVEEKDVLTNPETIILKIKELLV